MHGGKSTGARTKEGIERIKKANFKNGLYTNEMVEFRKLTSKLLKENKRFIGELLV